MNDLDLAAKELITVRDFIRWGASRFSENKLCFGHGTDSAWDEATQLVLHTLHLPPAAGEEVFDARLTSEERKLVTVVLATRIKERIPAAYLNGVAWFAGQLFKADERALVPRSPIAELIENQFLPWVNPSEVRKVLDLCTGGGCIGIATAIYLPHCTVSLADVSEPALQLAQSNIELHELEAQLSTYQSDLFSSLPKGEKNYDLIVSNPPYVDASDLSSMPAEYRHEPMLGLEAGEDGLLLVRKILNSAADYLSDHGVLIVEVGNSWLALSEAYPKVPFTWVDFERGGHGVFVLTKAQLERHFPSH